MDLGWRVVGASVRGTAHDRVGLPCQDALTWRTVVTAENAPVLLAALADGAGSAPRSDIGAQVAVEAALLSLTAGLETNLPGDDDGWSDLFRTAIEAARSAVIWQADSDGAPLRGYASTLICLALLPDLLGVAALGDGIVVAGDEDGCLETVSRLQRGEFANETYFLTQDDALERVQIEFLRRPATGVALMSDGLSRLALSFPEQTPHRPFFQPLFDFAAAEGMPALAGQVVGTGIASDSDANPPDEPAEQVDPVLIGSNGSRLQVEPNQQLEDFLLSERVCARTDDDKSLWLAVRPRVLP